MSWSYNISQKPYILFKLIILVCHLRRKHGLSDLHLTRERWDSFVKWVNRRIENLGCFRKGKAQRELYRIWYSKSRDKLSCLLDMLHYVLSHPDARAFLRNRSYLTDAAAQIAAESETLFVN